MFTSRRGMGPHDDQVDATAGAFNHLANSVAPTLEVPRFPMPKARW